MSLAQRVRDYRYSKGWGPDELANRAEISRTALYQIESGKTELPRAATLRRIALALDVSMDVLLGHAGGAVNARESYTATKGAPRGHAAVDDGSWSHRPTFAAQGRLLRGHDGLCHALHKGLLPSRVRPCPTLGRHLARLHAVMHLDPDGQIRGVFWVKGQLGQVEPAFLVHIVMTVHAVIADKGLIRRGKLCRTGGPSRDQGQHGESEKS